jgi:DNA invertase Pin-like site-specific DNA recombinase
METVLITKPTAVKRSDVNHQPGGDYSGWEFSHTGLTGKPFVCLYRVSTQGQKTSGLGLEVQLNGCRDYASHNGYIIAEFEEIVSGRANERPIFDQAVLVCRKSRATLLVYKLDRMSRTLQAVPDLMRQGVEMIVSTMPSASPVILCMLAALANDEAQRISYRTKEALAARRRRIGPPLVKSIMPDSVREAGNLTRTYRMLSKTRNLRDAARRNALKGLTTRQNADAIMLEYPLSGRIDSKKISRWLNDRRDHEDIVNKLVHMKEVAKSEMKAIRKKQN